jgi:hypothetical protein
MSVALSAGGAFLIVAALETLVALRPPRRLAEAMVAAALAGFCLIMMGRSAAPHDWYAAECCHNKDCHPTPCEYITRVDGGYDFNDR